MKKFLFCSAVAFAVSGASQAATVLPLTQAITVTEDGSATDVGSLSSGLSPEGAFNIRERRNAGQVDRRLSAYFQFDLSGLTPADTLQPGFQATFSTTYVSRLNEVNSAAATLGRVAPADIWDVSGTMNPLHAYGITNALDTQNLIADIATTAPTGQILSLDVTGIVTNWVNGTNANNGFALFVPILEAQAAGFGTPTLMFDVVPEPSVFALLGLGLIPLFRRRR
ncbi:MAG: DNRLRE domain-containing protein [Luteolibacter sp.]